jgi:MYXO-CTERM domain-containing protein
MCLSWCRDNLQVVIVIIVYTCCLFHRDRETPHWLLLFLLLLLLLLLRPRRHQWCMHAALRVMNQGASATSAAVLNH